jgi:N-acyl-D-amino-acid deacylase
MRRVDPRYRDQALQITLGIAIAIVMLAIASPALAVVPAQGQYVPQFSSVDTLFQNFMTSNNIPGADVAITHNGAVVYERGFGYTSPAHTGTVSETGLMRLASVSKPITAAAINKLVTSGKLSLDAKVFKIGSNGGLLDIPPATTLGDSRLANITVRELLQHTGGWNRDTAGDLAFKDLTIASAMGISSPPGIYNTARYILSQPLQFTPGTQMNYSNIGYMFLGMVVEQASGMPYNDYIHQQVLSPVGIPVRGSSRGGPSRPIGTRASLRISRRTRRPTCLTPAAPASTGPTAAGTMSVSWRSGV